MEKVGGEFGTAVRGDMKQDSVLGKDMCDKGLCDIYGSSGIDSRNEYTFLG